MAILKILPEQPGQQVSGLDIGGRTETVYHKFFLPRGPIFQEAA